MAKQNKEKGKKDHLIEGGVMLGIGVVFMLILCGAFGKAGAAITNFFVGSFGYAVYAYFLALIIFGILSLCNVKRPKIGLVRLLSLIMFFAMVIALMHCVSSLPLMKGNYGSYLSDCYNMHNTAGGVIAGVFLYPLLYVSYLGVVICGLLALAFAALFLFSDAILESFKSGKQVVQTPEMTRFEGLGANQEFEVVKSDLLVEDAGVFEKSTNADSTGEEYQPLGSRKVGQIDFGVLGDNSGISQTRVTSVDQREVAGQSKENPLSKRDEAYRLLYGNDPKEEKEEQSKVVGLGDASDYLSWTNSYRRQQIIDNSNTSTQPVNDDNKDFKSLQSSDTNENKGSASNFDFAFRPLGDQGGSVFDTTVNNNATETSSTEAIEAKPVEEKPTTSKYAEFLKQNNSNKSSSKGSVTKQQDQLPNDTMPKTQEKQKVEETFGKEQEEKPFVRNEYFGVQEKAYSDRFAEAQQKVYSDDDDALGADDAASETKDSSQQKQAASRFADIDNMQVQDKTATHSEIEGFEQLLKHQKEERDKKNEETVQKRHSFTAGYNTEQTDEDKISEEEARRERIRKERSDKGGVHNSSKQTLQDETKEEVVQTNPETNAQNSVTIERIQPSVTEQQPEQVVAEKVTEEVKREKTRIKLAPYKFPPIELLADYECKPKAAEDFSEKIQILETTLSEFGIDAKVNKVVTGPTFTRLELVMPKGVSVKKVLNYVDDVAMCLEVKSVRFQVPIPGKNAFGVEIPNANRGKVGLKSVIQSDNFVNSRKKIAFAVGQDCDGENFVADLAAMPHLLIAGATGAGKSVCLNSLIVSMLYKYTPDELKLLLVDPKQVELNMYNRIPHMLIPEAISDKTMALNMLDWAIEEMEARYTLFKDKRVQKITDYNAVIDLNKEDKLPYIVIIIDEVGDFMLVIKKELEERIQRLTQKARAAGIHLILATQRPSVDIITGVIKANLPARIAFAVTNFVDSKTILDQGGAEKLLRYGDMIFSDGVQDPSRLQGTLVEGIEVNAVCDYIRENNECYFDKDIEEFICNTTSGSNAGANPAQTSFGESTGEQDELFVRALYHVLLTGAVSISKLQRKFGIGFPRAARIVDTMEDLGYIRSSDGNAKVKEIVIDMPKFLAKYGDVKFE